LVLDRQSTGYVTILKSVSAFLAHMCHMQTFTSGSAVENEPEQNLADDFEHWPNEPATRNDLRILATRIDRRFTKIDTRFNKIDARFDKIDAQFAMVDARFTAQKSELQNAIRRDMFGFAAFLIFATTAVIGAIKTFII
jgi:hypothetical protein